MCRKMLKTKLMAVGKHGIYLWINQGKDDFGQDRRKFKGRGKTHPAEEPGTSSRLHAIGLHETFGQPP
jgi:hypothetical protein